MPSNKRPSEDAEGSSIANLSSFADRLEAHLSDKGSARKKQATAPSRTGQACDRCKIRKIRCDARVGGCSPCLQNNTECRTTDRITGRATSRGHTEKIEGENASLRMYIIELQQQLREKGVDPKPAPSAQPEYTTQQSYWSPIQEHQRLPPQRAIGRGHPGESGQNEAGAERNAPGNAALPDFRQGLIGDNYLGVSSGNSWLSPIEGTSLTLFGMKIDLSDFIPHEADPSEDAGSYQSFLKHAFGGKEQVYRPPLPTYELCITYASWYFRSVQMYLPVLHKPDFMDLLERIYKQNYQPNATELVSVHMMLSMIMFQYSHRNHNPQTRQESMQHYHYSLSFVPRLIEGHRLQDIQALSMICQLLRSQPRVGAAWMFTNMVLGLAIELGLHRSAKAWPDQLADQDKHTIEMRKRIFWSLITIQTTIGGKLGRPMPLRVEDFDIEIPEAIHDNLSSEATLPAWRKCSFRPATQSLKLTRIEMQVWSIIYSVGTPIGSYEANLQHFEREIQEFKSQLPPELSGGPETRHEDQITFLYLILLENEIRLLMHHPSLSRSQSPQSISHSYDVCLDAANKMMNTASQLTELNSLDTTWYFVADFLAAIFTTLFVYSERKDQITTSDVQRLQSDMGTWLDIMNEVGKILGTGPKLAVAIKGIIDQSITAISRHIAARTASAAVASTASPDGPNDQRAAENRQQQHHLQHTSHRDANGYNNDYGRNNVDRSMTSQPTPYPIQQAPAHSTTPHAYSSAGQYTYPEPQEPSMQHYAPAAPIPHYQNTYTTQEEEQKPALDAHLPAHQQQNSLQQQQHPQQPSNYMAAAYQTTSGGPSQNGFHAQTITTNTPQPNHHQPIAWRNFTDDMMTQIGGGAHQNYLQANHQLIMDMNHKPPSGLDMQALVASMNQGGMMQLADGQQPWPLLNYGTDVSGAGTQ